jgi:hypothetical protein
MAVEEGCPFGDVALTKTADSNGALSRISCRDGDDEAVRIALDGIVAVRLCRSRWYWQLFAGAHSDLAAPANLGEAVRVFDRCRILDTSEPWRRPRFVARAAGGKCTLEPAAPSWVASALQIDLGRG